MSNLFIRSLPVVASAMGNKMGVEVIIGDMGACTDGKRIYLPELPEGDDLFTLARGYIDHESAHIEDTNFSVWPKDKGPEQTMTNIIEDIRIEKKRSDRYPGCSVNLKKLVQLLADKGDFSPDQNDPGEVFSAWILSRGRFDYLKQDGVEKIADETEKLLRDMIGDDVMDDARKLMGEIPSLKSTENSKELANKILDLLGKQKNKPKKQDQNQQGQGGQGGGEKKDGSPQKGGGSQEKKDAIDKILNNKKDFGNISQILQEELNDKATSDPDKSSGSYPGEEFASHNRRTNFDTSKVREKTVGLRTKLSRMVAAQRLKRTHERQTGRKVNYRVLHRIAANNPRVFCAKELRTDDNTAVAILLDRSGSMAGREIKIAREATYAIADALDLIPGVAVTTAAFPSTRNRILVITPFGKSVKRTQDAYGIEATGGTPMLEAINWARTKMMQRTEPRKICLVITDGGPSDPQRVKKTIKKMEREGIEMMGIWIQSRVDSLFETSIMINNVSELTKNLFKLFEKKLVKKTV